MLIASALSLWLKEEGLSRSTIGWAGLIFGVYAFNFLWAPIIDRLKLPFLTNKVGQKINNNVDANCDINLPYCMECIRANSKLGINYRCWISYCYFICNSRYHN